MRLKCIRWTVLAGSFLLLLLIPILVGHLQFTFLQGWYQSLSIGDWWIVSPLEGMESILVSRSFYPPLLIGMLTPVAVALLLGRVFCSWLCPIHFLSEAGERVFLFRRREEIRADRPRLPHRLLWFVLAAELVLTLIVGSPLFVFLSPPGLVGRELMMAIVFHTLAVEGIVIVVVLALNLFFRRLYCRSLCPLGGLLALLGRRRSLRMVLSPAACTGCRRCDRACPLGLAASRGEGESSYCWNCGDCSAVCPRGALRFSWGRLQDQLARPQPGENGGCG